MMVSLLFPSDFDRSSLPAEPSNPEVRRRKSEVIKRRKLYQTLQSTYRKGVDELAKNEAYQTSKQRQSSIELAEKVAKERQRDESEKRKKFYQRFIQPIN